jgi:hypothetical protein
MKKYNIYLTRKLRENAHYIRGKFSISSAIKKYVKDCKNGAEYTEHMTDDRIASYIGRLWIESMLDSIKGDKCVIINAIAYESMYTIYWESIINVKDMRLTSDKEYEAAISMLDVETVFET